MRKLVLLLIAILICGLTFSCAAPTTPVPAQPSPAQPQPAPPPAATEVTTIKIIFPMPESWDADPDIDGIKLDLIPKDAKDRMVKTPGTVSAKLWLKPSFDAEKGDIVQQWSGIEVTKDDYGYEGVTIRLEYKDFDPKHQFGTLEVTLVTPDGNSFTDRESYMALGE